MVSTITYAVGYFLILLTAGSAASAALKRRETHRLDILALVALITLKPFYQQLGPVGTLLVLAVPYVLLRLVHHFREVSLALTTAALAVIPVGTATFMIWPPFSQERPAHLSLSWAYFVALALYAASAFASEARRSSGVTAKRLAFAGIGTL